MNCYIILYCNGQITNSSMAFANFEDIYKDDIVKTYKEWLRVQGQLDQISNITFFSQNVNQLIISPSQYIYSLHL